MGMATTVPSATRAGSSEASGVAGAGGSAVVAAGCLAGFRQPAKLAARRMDRRSAGSRLGFMADGIHAQALICTSRVAGGGGASHRPLLNPCRRRGPGPSRATTGLMARPGLENVVTTEELWAIILGFAMLGMALPPAVLLLWKGQNRLLRFTGALYLAILGTLDALYSVSLLGKLVWHNDFWQANGAYYTVVGFYVSSFAYLAFVGQAVASPLTKPLRSRGVLIGLGLAGTALLAYMLVGANQVADAAPDAASGVVIKGPVAYMTYFFVAAMTYGVASAGHAFMRAPKGTVARHRARLYLIAFGLNDLAIGIAVLLDHFSGRFGASYDAIDFFWYGVGSVATQIAGLAVLTWAVLRWSLLGIEIKLKLTVHRD